MHKVSLMIKRRVINRFLESRVKSDRVTHAEKWLGYLIGPTGAMIMISIASSFLNVYYTDVLAVSEVWNGMFLSIFPFVSKLLSIVSFLLMGRVIDRTYTRHGKARPWILVSAPVLVISTLLAFLVPEGGMLQVAWIVVSYNLLFTVVYPVYSTSHTLLVPLSTRSSDERSTLSLFTSAQMMIAGAIVAVMFPSAILPIIGVDKGMWTKVITVFALVAVPLVLMEYYYTRERIAGAPVSETRVSRDWKSEIKACLQSRKWVVLMLYMLVAQVSAALSGASTFYYCNWVLGSYNDGITQTLFYALGNAPVAFGLFICKPLYRRIGRRNAMVAGFILALCGVLICLVDPYNLPLVLLGQVIKSIGLIPSMFIVTALLADTLDDVEDKSGFRCDGLSSSVFGIIATLSSGLALGAFNFGLSCLGYIAPSVGASMPVQTMQLQKFFVFGAIGSLALAYLLQAILMFIYSPNSKAD